jgi:hypothetical protein
MATSDGRQWLTGVGRPFLPGAPNSTGEVAKRRGMTRNSPRWSVLSGKRESGQEVMVRLRRSSTVVGAASGGAPASRVIPVAAVLVGLLSSTS